MFSTLFYGPASRAGHGNRRLCFVPLPGFVVFLGPKDGHAKHRHVCPVLSPRPRQTPVELYKYRPWRRSHSHQLAFAPHRALLRRPTPLSIASSSSPPMITATKALPSPPLPASLRLRTEVSRDSHEGSSPARHLFHVYIESYTLSLVAFRKLR